MPKWLNPKRGRKLGVSELQKAKIKIDLHIGKMILETTAQQGSVSPVCSIYTHVCVVSNKHCSISNCFLKRGKK